MKMNSKQNIYICILLIISYGCLGIIDFFNPKSVIVALTVICVFLLIIMEIIRKLQLILNRLNREKIKELRKEIEKLKLKISL